MDIRVKYRCDIIVVTWNKLDYIKECTQSILKHTSLKARLIVVDNNSREDTKEYLKGLKGTETVDVKLIFNNENLGPGKARNIALKILDADYACFVDSDVTVTPGWLSNMIGLADRHPEIGMLNPASNNFNQAPPKGVSIDEYASTLRDLSGKYIEVGQCISFCMLVRAEAVRRIGLIDEEYVLALYEDTDYSMKASAAGFVCGIAKGSYVWHYGHGSTGRVKKINEIAEKNKARFYKKWGRPLRIFWASALYVENEAFRDVLATSIRLARDASYVYLNIREDRPHAKEDVFRLFNLVEHANVHIKFYNGRFFKLNCLWSVLIRRKKKYEIFVSDDASLASLVGRFRPLHKAEIAKGTGFEDIHSISQRKKFEGV